MKNIYKNEIKQKKKFVAHNLRFELFSERMNAALNPFTNLQRQCDYKMYDAIALVRVNVKPDADHINLIATSSAFQLKQKIVRFDTFIVFSLLHRKHIQKYLERAIRLLLRTIVFKIRPNTGALDKNT